MDDVKKRFCNHFKNVKVLEVGSHDESYTTRSLFTDCDYIGVDKIPGGGVDIVSDINQCDFPENTFDTVMALSIFEHDADWRVTLSNCIKWLKEGGICVISFGAEGNPHHLPEPWQPIAHKEFLMELVIHPVCLVVSLFEEDWYVFGCEAFSCVLRKGTVKPEIWKKSPGRYEWQGKWIMKPMYEPEDPMPQDKCYRVPSQDIISRGGMPH